jgi:hypothetical protein
MLIEEQVEHRPLTSLLQAERMVRGLSMSESTIRSSFTYGAPSRWSRSKNRRMRSSTSGDDWSRTMAPYSSARLRKRWKRSAKNIGPVAYASSASAKNRGTT